MATATETARVLVVEDRESLRELMARAIVELGCQVTTAATLHEGIEHLERDDLALVLTDLRLPDGDGMELLRRSRDRRPELPVVVMTGYGQVSSAVEAMKLGAADYREKPVDLDDLCTLVATLIRPTTPVLEDGGGAPFIVGKHATLRKALRLLRRVASTDSTVLLLGESGTGKELFARALHAFSPRSSGPFVAVNCAALPEALLEAELFGHERGAFTGADRRREGRFETAAEGTLLLDEIGELPMSVQAKVLRILEERTFERLGSSRTLRTTARLVAATNAELESLVAEGRFRADLFYRLEVFPIAVPPLRDRASDVPELARFLLQRAVQRHNLPDRSWSEKALHRLERHPWPGNVRQLSNLVERLAILSAGEIDLAAVDAALAPVAEDEEQRVRAALEAADGDKKRAAQSLGVSYRTLQRRIRDFGLQGFPRYR